MIISVEIPNATCDKCGAQSPVRPQYLCPDETDNQEPGPDPVSVDEDGSIWRVVTALRPKGWTAGPSAGTDLQRGLCVSCDAVWKSFLSATPAEFSAAPPIAVTVPPAARASHSMPPKLHVRPARPKPRYIRPERPTPTTSLPIMAKGPQVRSIPVPPVSAPKTKTAPTPMEIPSRPGVRLLLG